MSDKSNLKHWYPKYTDDYAKDTKHLSMLEHGAYNLLLDHYFATEKPIPANAVQVHRICMALADDEQVAVQSVLQQFFTLEDDGYHNLRADEEIEKKKEISKKRQKAAKKSHENRKNKSPANAGANADTTTTTTTTTTTNINNSIIAKITELFILELNGYVQPIQNLSRDAKDSLIDAHFELFKSDFENWKKLFAKVKENDFYLGVGSNGWVITLQWLSDQNKIVKILNEKPKQKKTEIKDHEDELDGAALLEKYRAKAKAEGRKI